MPSNIIMLFFGFRNEKITTKKVKKGYFCIYLERKKILKKIIRLEPTTNKTKQNKTKQNKTKKT
jgi:hypothetical protein